MRHDTRHFIIFDVKTIGILFFVELNEREKAFEPKNSTRSYRGDAAQPQRFFRPGDVTGDASTDSNANRNEIRRLFAAKGRSRFSSRFRHSLVVLGIEQTHAQSGFIDQIEIETIGRHR